MSDRITRRRFAGAVAASSTLISSCGITGIGQPGEAAQKKSEASAKGDEPQSTLELFTQIVKQEFPHEKLDAIAIEEVRSDLLGNLSRSKVLSAFPLTNVDEPGFIFAAWRSDGVL